jgi:ATP-dependent RNA helicase DHX8/PRP22
MEDLERLKMISLKEKVGRELEIHLQLKDNELIEFLIAQCQNCSSEDEFFSKMNKIDESFTLDFANSIFFLVHGILDDALPNIPQTTIAKPVASKVDPKLPKKELTKEEQLQQNFPALAIDDKKGMNNNEELDIDFSTVSPDKKTKKIKKEKKKKLHKKRLKIGRVFKGRVKKVLPYGVIVSLKSKNGYSDGLVHISNIKTYRVNDIHKVLKWNDKVFVRVTAMENNRISLSMKDVDQETGEGVFDNQHRLRQERMQALFQGKAIDMGNLDSEQKNEFSSNMTGIKEDLTKKKTIRLNKHNGNSPDPWEKKQ